MEIKNFKFKLEELLHPTIFEKYKNNQEEGWKLLDIRLLEVLHWLRELVDSELYINTWLFNGNRINSGLREKDSPVGVKNSKHKLGMAVDIISNKYSAQHLRDIIEKNKDTLPYSIRIERNVNWLHIDTANTTSNKIQYFNPN